MPALAPQTVADKIADEIRSLDGILEMHDVAEILSYLENRPYAASECIDADSDLHASCGNQGKADLLFDLARRCDALPVGRFTQYLVRETDEGWAVTDYGKIVEGAVYETEDFAWIAVQGFDRIAG